VKIRWPVFLFGVVCKEVRYERQDSPGAFPNGDPPACGASASFYPDSRGKGRKAMNSSHRSLLVAAALLGLVCASVARAETPPFDYETAIPDYWLSHGHGVTVDAGGNAFVIASWYQDHQHLDILVAKLNDKGDVLWTLPIVGDELHHD
jgi:hypothetical protein